MCPRGRRIHGDCAGDQGCGRVTVARYSRSDLPADPCSDFAARCRLWSQAGVGRVPWARSGSRNAPATRHVGIEEHSGLSGLSPACVLRVRRSDGRGRRRSARRLTVKPSGQLPPGIVAGQELVDGSNLRRRTGWCRLASVGAMSAALEHQGFRLDVHRSRPPSRRLPGKSEWLCPRCPSSSWTTRAGAGAPNREGGSPESPRAHQTSSAIPSPSGRREDDGRGVRTCPAPLRCERVGPV